MFLRGIVTILYSKVKEPRAKIDLVNFLLSSTSPQTRLLLILFANTFVSLDNRPIFTQLWLIFFFQLFSIILMFFSQTFLCSIKTQSKHFDFKCHKRSIIRCQKSFVQPFLSKNVCAVSYGEMQIPYAYDKTAVSLFHFSLFCLWSIREGGLLS